MTCKTTGLQNDEPQMRGGSTAVLRMNYSTRDCFPEETSSPGVDVELQQAIVARQRKSRSMEGSIQCLPTPRAHLQLRYRSHHTRSPVLRTRNSGERCRRSEHAASYSESVEREYMSSVYSLVRSKPHSRLLMYFRQFGNERACTNLMMSNKSAYLMQTAGGAFHG